MKHLLVSAMIALLIVGCGKKIVKPAADAPPVSHEVREVESTSSAETMLRATGQGPTVEIAISDAKKAAIWYLLYAGTKPLLKTPEEKRAAQQVEGKLYASLDKYVRHTSDLKSKRKSGETTIVDIVVKLDVAMIKDFLVSNDVIRTSAEVADEVGLPAISIVASKTGKDADIAKNTLSEYLSDRNFEVNVVEQSGKLGELTGKLAKLSGNTDPAYAWALEAGSEVYIEVKVNTEKGVVSGVSTKKASVTANAYETSTARQLGSTTGHSSERAASGYDALIQEAANAVADKIISQIRKSWLQEADKGKWFKLIAFTNTSDADKVDRAIYRALKSMPSAKIKRLAAGKSTFQYQVRVKEIANAFELLDSLSMKYQGPGKITRELESGTLLVIKAGSGDIEIEFD
ncbi:MAG: DUF6175 family protein [Gammaproteobacteria bacterium]|nr:DUF6175 family protein [Gammaproteobacteria bacterium]